MLDGRFCGGEHFLRNKAAEMLSMAFCCHSKHVYNSICLLRLLGDWTHAFCTQPCRPALIVSLVCCQQKKSVLKDLADFAAVFKFACGKRAAEIAGQLLLFLKDFTGCRSSAFCLTAKHAGSEVCCVSFSISYVLNNLPLDRTTLSSSHKKRRRKIQLLNGGTCHFQRFCGRKPCAGGNSIAAFKHHS